MIRVRINDPDFYKAYWNAKRAMPVEQLETPGQYGERWREAYKCRHDPHDILKTMIFDRDEDYTWFMLQWG